MKQAWNSVIARIPKALQELKLSLPSDEDLDLLAAGVKRDKSERAYRQVFIRDTHQSLLLLEMWDLLRDHVTFGLRHRGHQINSHTGEEPGKPPHEFPAPEWRGLTTEFAAVDTAAYGLIGAVRYWKETGDGSFIEQQASDLADLYDYIITHSDEGLIRDDPADVGANRWALTACYFRDGGFWEFPFHKQPYPAYYFNASALAISALRGLADLRDDGLLPVLPTAGELRAQARLSVASLNKHHWHPDGYFCAVWYRDPDDRIDTMYLDPVWSCRYLDPEDLSEKRWDDLFASLERLKCDDGYFNRERAPGYGEDDDNFQVIEPSIWPIETAELILLAERQERPEVKNQALKLADRLATDDYPFRECIDYGNAGYFNCEYQLWTVAFWKVVAKVAG